MCAAVFHQWLDEYCEQKFVQHGPITITIECNGHSLLIFEEKWVNYASGLKSAPNSDSFWMRAGFLCAKCENFACLRTRQDQNEIHLKRWFFFFCQNRHRQCKSIADQSCSRVYTTIFVRRKDKTNYLVEKTR